MDYLFPPSTIISLPAALHPRSEHDAGDEAPDGFGSCLRSPRSLGATFGHVMKMQSHWRPVIQLTLCLLDVYGTIDYHRFEATAVDVEARTHQRSDDETSCHEWDAPRPPTPSLDDSVRSTPSCNVGPKSPSSRSTRHNQRTAVPSHVDPALHLSVLIPSTIAKASSRDGNSPGARLGVARTGSRSTFASSVPPLKVGGDCGHFQGAAAASGSGNTAVSFTTALPRILTEPSELVAKFHSDGQAYEVDNANGDLVLFVGMMLCERYEVLKLLGCGTFGQVVMCRDHVALQHNAELAMSAAASADFVISPHGDCSAAALSLSTSALGQGAAVPITNPTMTVASISRRSSLRIAKTQSTIFRAAVAPAPHASHAAEVLPEIVAVKVIKSDAAYERQSALEVNVVREMAQRFPDDPRLGLVVRSYGHAYSYGHYCIAFELLGASLFDVLRANEYRGMDLSAVREVAEQVLMAVSLCHDCGITHSDIKPENVLLVRSQPDSDSSQEGSPLLLPTGTRNSWGGPMRPSKGSVRLIDFGAAFRTGCCPFTYIQSRYYRAPEVILDHDKLSSAIDVWSVGCLLAELFLGLPLLPGGDDFEQLQLMTEMIGPFPMALAGQGRLTKEFMVPRPSQGQPLKDQSPYFLSRTATNPFDFEGAAGGIVGGSSSSSSILGAGSTEAAESSTVDWVLRAPDEFYAMHPHMERPAPQPRYFNYASVAALVDNYPLSERERMWALEAQSAYSAAQAGGDKSGASSSAAFGQPVIDGILRARRNFTSLLTALLQMDPSKRPTAQQALRHPFFTVGLPDPCTIANA